MTRVIHCPEFHFSPATAKNTLYAMAEVAKNAREFKDAGDDVYCISSGDLHDRSLQATERQGFGNLIDAVSEIASASTKFIMMYGTRSTHDIEGSYKAYEFIPNAVVLSKDDPSFFDDNIAVCSLEEPMPSEYKNEDVLTYTTRLSLAAKLFFDAHKGKLKIVMAHGVILCDETVDTPAVKFGGVHYNELQFVDSGADIALAGHLHHGYKFHDILGGYALSLAHAFSDDGFVPSFDVYSKDIVGAPEFTESVILDLPARFNAKVLATTEKLEIADVKNINEVHGALPSSRIMVKPRVEIEKSANTTATRQAIVEELKAKYPFAEIEYPELKEIRESKARNIDIKSSHSYREQAKLVYPDWTEKDFAAMDWLEEEDQKDGTLPSDVSITPKWIDIAGYKPFKNGLGKDHVYIDFSAYGASVIGIVAPGGSGKSSLSDLVFPHPECLSQPAMKTDLFGLPESYIRQAFDVNGNEVLCEIKGNAETGKFVYLCSVNGVEKCRKGLREYKEVVNQIFGPIHEYALTVVRTQFRFLRTIDGMVANPEIKYATNKELKDIYNSLIGNDKSATQKRCKEKADAFKAKSAELSNKLAGINSSIDSINSDAIDIDAEKRTIATFQEQVAAKTREVEGFVADIATISANVDKRSDIEKRYNSARISLMDAESSCNAAAINSEISALEAESTRVTEYQKEIDGIDSIQKQNEEIASRNSEAQSEYNTEYSAWSDRRNAVMKKREEISASGNAAKALVSSLESDKQRCVSDIEKVEQWLALVKACPKCGYVDEETERQRKEKNEQLSAEKAKLPDLEAKIVSAKADYDALRKKYSEAEFSEPAPDRKPAEPLLPCGDRAMFQQKINSAQSGLVRIAELRAKLESGANEVERIKGEIVSLKDALDLIPDVSATRNDLVLKKSLAEDSIKSITANIDAAKSRLAKAEQNAETIKKLSEDAAACEIEMNEAENGYNDWSRYQKAWGKDGIPARFIELEAPIVDATANEILAQFYPKLYIESKTTKTGSDGKTMDDFDVRVYNTEEATEQSLSSISGEQANFVLSAMYFAFRQAYTRNKRININVCVEDEPDANVGVDMQGRFCDMVRYQQNIENKQRLYISHSPEVQSLLENVLYLQEL